MPKGPVCVRNLGTLDDYLSDTEAREVFHYRVTLDDKDRLLVEERYKEGLVLLDRAEFAYALNGATEITTTKCYDAAGNYIGKVVGKFTPPDVHEAEVYDAEDHLTDKTNGLFQYQIMNGKPVVE